MPSPTIDQLFECANAQHASDIHLVTGKPPLMRVDGIILPITEGDEKPLSGEDIEGKIRALLTVQQMERFEKEREIDFSHEVASGVRFRVNCHFEREHMGLVARVIPDAIPSLKDLAMPEIVMEVIRADRGIILATGPTGCGKSTTLAALIETINQERPVHIVTLEDPIEFLYHPKKALIRQRQYGTDFLSFSEAMKRVLRQDPDVLLVGEMRDLETIAAALTLAETGHLVLGTLHTNNAVQTVDRVIDVFPPHQQQQIRTQLSMTLRAVIAQRLVPKKGGGRVAIREVMMNTPAVSNIIRDNRIAELHNVIQTSAAEGMITMDRDIVRLGSLGLLEKQVAMEYASNPDVLKGVKPQKKRGFFS